MLKAANIFVALFLALAPGMDAVRLLHAVQVCHAQALTAVVHGHEEHGPDHHGQPCGETPTRDCPHLKNLPHGAPVLAVAAPVSVILPGPPVPTPATLAVTPCTPPVAVFTDSRPPPGPPLVGCVKLLI